MTPRTLIRRRRVCLALAGCGREDRPNPPTGARRRQRQPPGRPAHRADRQRPPHRRRSRPAARHRPGRHSRRRLARPGQRGPRHLAASEGNAGVFWRHRRSAGARNCARPRLVHRNPGAVPARAGPLRRRHLGPGAAPDERVRDYFTKQNADLRAKLAARPDVYGQPELREIDAARPDFGAPGSIRHRADLPQRPQLADGRPGRSHVQGLLRGAQTRRRAGRGRTPRRPAMCRPATSPATWARTR